MRKQDIKITISPTGEVSFTIEGVKGASCLDETKFLEDALGNGVLLPPSLQQPTPLESPKSRVHGSGGHPSLGNDIEAVRDPVTHGTEDA